MDIIINLGENVFDNAVVSTAIILLEKKKENSKIKIADLSANSKFLGSLDRIVFLEIVQTTFNDTENNIFVMNIRRKAENEYSLGEIMELKDAGINYQRVNVGLSDKGKSDLSKRLLYEGEKETESDKEFWKGEDINAYYIIENTNRFVRNDIKLNENERVILNRKYFKIIPKLIWRQTAQYPICTIDYIGIWFGRSIQAGIIKDSFINRVSYEYLCGLLNSKYLRYLYENNVRETGKVFPQVKLEKLRPLPIIISKNQSSIVNLVNEAIKIKKEDSKADITNIENQIDILVYKLYGLSYEEMEVITPNIKEIISKEDYETE